MRASEFWHKVIRDQSNLLDDFLALLRHDDIPYCVIGGQAVKAYVEPLVSLDLDIVIALLRNRHCEKRFLRRSNLPQHSQDCFTPAELAMTGWVVPSGMKCA